MFVGLLCLLSWWSDQFQSMETPSFRSLAQLQKSLPMREAATVLQSSYHGDLLETLDRLVTYERYYRSVYGHFTKVLSRTGYATPHLLSKIYEIRVVEASLDRLLIRAFSEHAGKTTDHVSIDHNYQLNANFSLPLPRAEYLRVHALKQLHLLRDSLLRDSSGHQKIAERGVFQGYFRYEAGKGLLNDKSVYAVGIKPPVVGVQVELGSQREISSQWTEGDLQFAHLTDIVEEIVGRGFTQAGTQTGQRSIGNIPTSLEEVYLAQQIFYGEMGRYAKSWVELSKIAQFQFEKRQLAGEPFIDFLKLKEIQEGNFQEKADSKQELEIEPVFLEK